MNGLRTLKGNYKIYKFAMLLFAVFASFFAILYANEFAKNARRAETIFILDGEGNVGSATRKAMEKTEITAEIINNLSMFTKLMYEMDQHGYEDNLALALNLAGDVGMEIVDEKEQDEELKKMIQLNVRSTVDIDYDSFSVERDENGIFYGSFQFRRNMIRNETERVTLLFTVNYRVVRTGQARTVKNPHAMNIVAFDRTSIRL